MTRLLLALLVFERRFCCAFSLYIVKCIFSFCTLLLAEHACVSLNTSRFITWSRFSFRHARSIGGDTSDQCTNHASTRAWGRVLSFALSTSTNVHSLPRALANGHAQNIQHNPHFPSNASDILLRVLFVQISFNEPAVTRIAYLSRLCAFVASRALRMHKSPERETDDQMADRGLPV